jgi:hypothetical protein
MSENGAGGRRVGENGAGEAAAGVRTERGRPPTG